MNFFEQQDRARQNTTRLVVLFGLAVLAIIFAVYAVCIGSLMLMWNEEFEFWAPEIFAYVVGITTFGVTMAAFIRFSNLRQGGVAIATMLGGRQLNPGCKDPLERRYVNVVEEMAIASGISVPLLFVLEEEGINAFAAGFGPDDAIVAVTRGALTTLTRDELQGVVAHEFSHILNGDMRLNIRLLGVLGGILFISGTGRVIIELASRTRTNRRDTNAAGVIALILFGVAIWLVGTLGVFFARLLQLAVSRQREFLADASAVQFTRNPMGIGNALKRIGASNAGTLVVAPGADEVAHMFFADGIKRWLWPGLLATHPPLEERIERIGLEVPRGLHDAAPAHPTQQETPGVSGLSGAASHRSRPTGFSPKKLLETVGQVGVSQLTASSEILATMPMPLREAAQSSLGALAILFTLLLDDEKKLRKEQLTLLEEMSGRRIYNEIKRLYPLTQHMDSRARLPLLELAAPGLRLMSKSQQMEAAKVVKALISADFRISLREFCVLSILRSKLVAIIRPATADVIGKSRALSLAAEFAVILSALAHVGHETVTETEEAFLKACTHLPQGFSTKMALEPDDDHGFKRLEAAFVRVAKAAPQLKANLLDACAHCVLVDGHVRIEEMELLRTVAHAIGVPLPAM